MKYGKGKTGIGYLDNLDEGSCWDHIDFAFVA